MIAERDVVVFCADESRQCALSITENAYHDYQLVLHTPWGQVSATGRDLFAALANLRRELEPSGWMIAVQGSRKQAYASGLLRDMGGARRVYICKLGRHAERADLVDIFAEAPTDDVVTVDQQAEWFRDWRASLPHGSESGTSR